MKPDKNEYKVPDDILERVKAASIRANAAAMNCSAETAAYILALEKRLAIIEAKLEKTQADLHQVKIRLLNKVN